MKNKFSILLIVFFTFIFIIFYKGLNNSNIYVPSTQVEKDVPDLKVKLLRSQNEIELKSLFEGNEFLEDNNGSKSIELGAYGVPESFLIHQNKIIRKYIGPLNQNLFTEINSLIK